jgi:beta-galactosidase
MKIPLISSSGLVFTIAIILSGVAATAQKIFPDRNRNFDFDWRFSLGDTPEASSLNFNDSNWRTLDLPHDWSIEGITDPKNPTGRDGGYFPAGTGWYRKTFNVQSTLKKKQIGIYFEGVYMNSEVFINGRSVGIQPYGYSSFYYDLTEHIMFGKDNVIAVRVDNSQQKNCRWYSGSGIYRHVQLIVTNPVHFQHWGLTITTPSVSQESATIQLKAIIGNETKQSERGAVMFRILDKQGIEVAKKVVAVDLRGNGNTEVVQEISLSDPELWHFDSPALYKAEVSILKNGKLVDMIDDLFGIRKITFSTSDGFQLNGQEVKLNGGCVHHDNGCLGAAAYDAAEIRRVKLLKEGGFNAVRTSHNIPSEAFLYACDSLGLLVIDESFDGWRESKTPHDYAKYFDAWWQRDIDAMVLRDRNHPSIIMWSIGNEIIERKKPEAIHTASMLAGRIRELDPTRPVTSAMTTWDREWEMFDSLFAAHDVGGYNYQLHRAESDHQRVPSRIIVQTESYPRDAFANWKYVQDNSYIIGDFVWTAMDYLGESGIGRYYYPGEPDGQHWERDFYPWHGAYCGDIDLIGWRKPISHYRSLLYNENEKLYLAVKEPNPPNGVIKETMWSVWPTWNSWTWPGFEGKTLQVEIYSRYPKVRLYLNDRLVGEQLTTREQEFKATFNVNYAEGVLRAVGVESDKEVQSTQLVTAKGVAKVILNPDRKQIKADRQDLCYVTVEITDEEGTLQPNAGNALSFKIKGPGIIAGVDNANLKDTDPYVAGERKAWNGRALVVVKATGESGVIELEVNSPGLASGKILITSVK